MKALATRGGATSTPHGSCVGGRGGGEDAPRGSTRAHLEDGPIEGFLNKVSPTSDSVFIYGQPWEAEVGEKDNKLQISLQNLQMKAVCLSEIS